jgi:hypothetical protein
MPSEKIKKKLSESHKKRISESNKGKIFSEDHRKKLREARIGKEGFYKGKTLSLDHRLKIGKSNRGKERSLETRKKLSEINKLTIEKIKERYPLFTKIEEMKLSLIDFSIQFHCKNHNCPNSKEKGGWFSPTKTQIFERIRAIEKQDSDLNYFYCSDNCKNSCPLFKSRSDPFKNKDISYTQQEYNIFKKFILERDFYICQFCGEKATDVHHERPQKLEPFFALDPDYAWSCCEKCHYEKGHKDDCTTGKLSKLVCI